MFTRIFAATMLIVCSVAWSQELVTRQQVMDSIQAKPNVVTEGVKIVAQGTFMNGSFGTTYYSTIMWLVDEGDVVKKYSADLIVKEQGVIGQENVIGWLNELPNILKPAAEVKYITDRAGGGFTEAQVKTKVAEVWANAMPAAGAIIGMTVSTVDGKTIRVSGSFDNGANGREVRTYLLWLVDANGSVAAGNANIKWQRETIVEVAAP